MKYNKTKEIYSPSGKALGDCWSIVNYCINLGLEKKEIVRLAPYYIKGESRKRPEKMLEILPLLEHDDMMEFVEEDPTLPIPHWTEGYKYPFIPTKKTWSPNQNKKICYQFDGKSRKGQKNFPSKEIEEKILEEIKNLGYKLIKLGHEISLKQCIQEASESEIFIGIDSGMCYLAASVGIPIIFCRNNRTRDVWDTAHSNKHFILTENYIELIDSIKKYKEKRLDYYLDNAENLHLYKKGK